MASEADIAAVVGRRYWREAEARVVVEAWRASGESLAGFARRHAVGSHARDLPPADAAGGRAGSRGARRRGVGLMLEGVDLRGAARWARWRPLPFESAAAAGFARG